MEATLKRTYGLLLLQLAACWPVWRWYALRWRDGSDDAWGIVALLAALALLWQAAHTKSVNFTPRWLMPALAMLAYALSYHWLSPLPRAVLALCAVLAALRFGWLGERLHLGIVGLFVLSLPLLASLQFYLGYPLRLLVARPAAAMLRLGGLSVVSEATALRWNEQLIQIDAPCSGIKMLWAGAFLVCVLSVIYRLSWRLTLAASALALLVILAGNVWRATALFYLEAGLVALPTWAHSGIGVATFALTAALLAWLVRRLSLFHLQPQTQ